MSDPSPRLAVLVSGEGTNLQAIIDQVASGALKTRISVVISDQLQAKALHRAQQAGIPTHVVEKANYKNREDYDAALLEKLSSYSVDLIVLAGFMRILSPSFLKAYPDRVINIHPSLLPKYPGLNAIQKAFENKDSETGVTVHYVNEGVDTGPTILQERVAILPADTLKSLTDRIHRVEHQIYPKAIQKVLWRK